MEEKSSLSLSTVIALIKRYASQYETAGIKKVEGVPPSSIKFTLTDGSHYTIALNLTADGISFKPTSELLSTNVQDAIEEMFEKLNGEHHLTYVDFTNVITGLNVDNSGIQIQADALLETPKTESEVPITFKIPIKGTPSVIVDQSEGENTITIHLDYSIVSKLDRALVTPVSRPSSTKFVAVDRNNVQNMIEVGQGLTIEYDTLKQRTIVTGEGSPTTLTDCYLGQMYLDTTGPTVYICTGVSGGNYTWRRLMLE